MAEGVLRILANGIGCIGRDEAHQCSAPIWQSLDLFRTHQVDEYIVEGDDAGSPPRTPEQALQTARVGYQFLRTVRF